MGSVIPTQLAPGRPWPLGAHWDGRGVNVVVASSHASAIELCLFDDDGEVEIARLPLPGRSGDLWHGYLPGAGPGLVYGLRADGPWQPERGQRFDPAKLLLDPYARDIVGDFDWRPEHFSCDPGRPGQRNGRDNARWALKARVVVDAFDWGDDQPPATPLAQTVLYECHVKGFSMRNPAVPAALRGTLAGLAHPASIAHLRALGVTAVSLLPVHYRLSEQRLVQLGLSNYWGYNTLGFFCVDPRLCSGADGLSPRDEFRAMVRALHAAGLEVILDVVYNHSAEGDQTGPTLSLRGLDNASYYQLQLNDPSHYKNFSGCGNTLDLCQNRVLQLVMDSLRYWVGEMHVDGFRFDLASVLGRTPHGFDARAAFFTAVAQDPLLSRVKMIAEPWDLGPGGYQLSGFPNGWLEWNDQFRDSMRRFWVQAAATPHLPVPSSSRGDFAMRLCGSSDLYQGRARAPAESVNYVVSHDGFTLRDLLSYNERHNRANGEDNRDGHGHNLSYNCGVEGPSSEPAVQDLRARLQRALLATALLAQGTPMLCAGDELGHSQHGNNNPYCQDNATTWIDWATADTALLAFTRHVLALRRQLQPFANAWYHGVADRDGVCDLCWLRADGQPMRPEDWQHPTERALACLIGRPGGGGAPLLLLVNAGDCEIAFTLPAGRWQGLLDSARADGRPPDPPAAGAHTPLAAHSLMLLQALGAMALAPAATAFAPATGAP